MESNILLALAAHFLGDFGFENDWMARKKEKSWEINFYHAAVYTSAFILLRVDLSVLSIVIIFISHFIIDPFKSMWGIIKHIWIDQLLHLSVLMFIFVYLEKV